MSQPSKPNTVLVNGTLYNVLATERDGLLMIRRPNGVKLYVARRLPDSPIYGENRGQILAPAGLCTKEA